MIDDSREEYGLPVLWWLSMALLALVGVALAVCSLQPYEWVTYLAPSVPKQRWSFFIAIYLFGIVGGNFVCYWTTYALASLFDLNDAKKRINSYPPAIVGLCEAVLYPSSFLMGKPEFIGVWLALKVAGQWKMWQDNQVGRRRFNRFLVGNALSVIVGVLVYKAIKSFILRA